MGGIQVEPRFEIQTTIDRELMKHFAQYTLKKPRVRIGRIPLLLMGLFEIWVSGPVFTTVGVLVILYALLLPLLLQWSYWRRNQPKAGTQCIHTFFDDRFTAVNGTLTQTVQYDDLFVIEETKEVFALRRDRNGAAILPKSAFTAGSPEDFRKFIEEKTGKQIKFIR